MVVMMLMAQRHAFMGPFVLTRQLRYLGRTATAAMALAVLVMLLTMFLGSPAATVRALALHACM